MESTHVPDLSGQVELLSYRAAFNGPYSAVYRGRLRHNNEMVAVKVLNAIQGVALHAIRRKIERERRTWSALHHQNILPLYGFADDDDMFQPFGAFISPWRQRGDLVQYLQQHGATAPLWERLNLWRDVVAGVAYLHGHNPLVIHGDLKPGNILIDEQGVAQICDFGLVRVLLEHGSSGMTTTTAHTGTDRYLACELVMAEDSAIPTTASDVYAVGCIGLEASTALADEWRPYHVMQTLFRQLPYSNPGNNLRWYMRGEIQAGRPPATRPHDLIPVMSTLWDIAESCWARDSSLRPEARKLSRLLGDASYQPMNEDILSHQLKIHGQDNALVTVSGGDSMEILSPDSHMQHPQQYSLTQGNNQHAQQNIYSNISHMAYSHQVQQQLPLAQIQQDHAPVADQDLDISFQHIPLPFPNVIPIVPIYDTINVNSAPFSNPSLYPHSAMPLTINHPEFLRQQEVQLTMEGEDEIMGMTQPSAQANRDDSAWAVDIVNNIMKLEQAQSANPNPNVPNDISSLYQFLGQSNANIHDDIAASRLNSGTKEIATETPIPKPYGRHPSFGDSTHAPPYLQSSSILAVSSAVTNQNSPTPSIPMGQFTTHQQAAVQSILAYIQAHPRSAFPGSLITSELAEVQDGHGWCLIGDCGRDRAAKKCDYLYDSAKDQKKKRLDHLFDHIRDKHFDCRPYRCPHPRCTRSFSREHDLKRHEKTHPLVSLPCNVCGKSYTREDNLALHMKLKHRSSLPFTSF